jgi:nucleotide-binding universal stress UspA family protein
VTLLRVVPSTESDTASAEAAPYLEKVAAELAAKGVRVRTQVRLGNPAAEIVRAARDLGADLVAMTTGGRGGLGRMLLGSVAETVLRTADVPLFLFRHVGRPAA